MGLKARPNHPALETCGKYFCDVGVNRIDHFFLLQLKVNIALMCTLMRFCALFVVHYWRLMQFYVQLSPVAIEVTKRAEKKDKTKELQENKCENSKVLLGASISAALVKV